MVCLLEPRACARFWSDTLTKRGPRRVSSARASFVRVLASSSPSVDELDARRGTSRPHEADVVARIAAEAVEDLKLERRR